MENWKRLVNMGAPTLTIIKTATREPVLKAYTEHAAELAALIPELIAELKKCTDLLGTDTPKSTLEVLGKLPQK